MRCCPWVWSVVVLKDKISVLGPVVGLEGVVLAKDYTSTIFTDLTDCIKNGRLPQVNIYLTLFMVFQCADKPNEHAFTNHRLH